MAGLASDNSLEAILPDLMILEDDGSGNTSTAGPQSIQEFLRVCDAVWFKVQTLFNPKNETRDTTNLSELARKFLDTKQKEGAASALHFLETPAVDSARQPASRYQ